MVTSLANFRSDFTIVPIPGGNYLETREQLYTNINVLRMGCSGRGALTLERPRFVFFIHPPDSFLIHVLVTQRRIASPLCIIFRIRPKPGLMPSSVPPSSSWSDSSRLPWPSSACLILPPRRETDYCVMSLGRVSRDGLPRSGSLAWVSKYDTIVSSVAHTHMISYYQPMERVADPTVVSALFSMVLSVRNKLHALGHVCRAIT